MNKRGYILNPPADLLPDFKICPFSNEAMHQNKDLPDSDAAENYFAERFASKRYYYTLNGREAINMALSYYNLNPDDCVTILTTSGNTYISSCVTNEIEKFCKWSMNIEKQTKILFLNHEFGFPYEHPRKLKQLGFPIIEDCAHSFFSEDDQKTIGTIGDFVVYSIPKMFPVQIGGILLCNLENYSRKPVLNNNLERYVKNVISNHIITADLIKQKRISNYHVLKELIKAAGFEERFTLKEGVVPGVFMFRSNEQNFDFPGLKKHMYKNGIQCSVFYGEKAFYIPVHQNLNEEDLHFFVEVIKGFKSGEYESSKY
jgi:hypothetical protein